MLSIPSESGAAGDSLAAFIVRDTGLDRKGPWPLAIVSC
jgi:hypothetical protein